MKKALLLTIGAVLISGCSRSAPTEKMAKDYLQSKEYDVLEFQKTNGIKGAEEYTFMYTAKLKFKEDKGWPISEWEAGETRIWTGEIVFKNSENGWLPVGNTIKTSVHESGGKSEARSEANKWRAQFGSLSSVRSAIQVYYGDNEGWFPTDLAVLTSKAKYLSAIPSTSIDGISKNNVVHNIAAWDGQCSGVTNSGGWIYGNIPSKARNDKFSHSWGNFAIDSDKLSPEGHKWCSY